MKVYNRQLRARRAILQFIDVPLRSRRLLYRVAQKKTRNSRFFLGLCSDQQLSFFTLLDRTSFPHYNNTKIIKFGWKLFILWVISYGLSFSGFAINFSLVGGPPKNGTVNFLGLCSDEQLLLDRAYFPHYNDTNWDHQIWLKTCYFMSNILSTVIFWDLPLICHRASKLWKSGKSRKWQSIRNVS